MLGSRGPICSALEKMPSSTAAVVGVAALFGAAAAFTCGLYYGSTGKTKTRSKPRSLDLGASPEANYKMVRLPRPLALAVADFFRNGRLISRLSRFSRGRCSAFAWT